ncbi:hypothetical protein HMI54_012289 [Coelomomyces lativittatus]|nr:hypothetical protein HMI56_001393 [Coelomomyces lativittatus]KAJ1515469.1 hypothetical protein HMI54_012289 [Coelomomyces lativittatus]
MDTSNVQFQIRQNATDYQNFLKELNQWESQLSKNKTSFTSTTEQDLEKKKKQVPIRSVTAHQTEPLTQDSEDSASTNKELANVAKETGNHYFKSGKFQKSIQYYSKAIDLDPTSSTIYLNRAFSYLKLGQWHEAEEDCTKTLSRDMKSVKAYWRRSQARKELAKFTEAKEDLEKALVLEPQNKLFKEALQSLSTPEKKIEPPQRRRLKVREIDSEIQFSTLQETKFNISLEKDLPQIQTPSTSIPKSTEEKKTSKSIKPHPFNPPTLPIIPKQWHPPTASYEFDRDIKSISDIAMRKEYLKSIPPNKLPLLFKSSIDATQLATCIDILHSFNDTEEPPNLIYNYLYFLSQCPRFLVVYALLEQNEKKMLTSLFSRLVSSFQDNPSALSKVTLLRTKYAIELKP